MKKHLQKLQKDSGIKMGQYDNDKNRLFHQGKMLLQVLEIYIKEIESLKMTDEQFFIDFEDSINELSIKDHNADPE